MKSFLPSKRKREAKCGLIFSHFIKANPQFETSAFELKQTRTDSIPFNSVAPHQIQWLKASVDGTFLYKIPDDSRGIKPCDYVLIRRAERAFVVIFFPTFFCFIDVHTFENQSNTSKRRSLTSTVAKEIAYLVVHR